MEIIKMEETSKTPSVYFDANQGLIEITGRVIPEDSKKFFSPLINWVKMYKNSPCKKTTVNIKLEYFSTSASKLILELLKELEHIYKEKYDIVINWFYELDDSSMIEAFDAYQSMIIVPINGIETIFPSN